MADEKEREKKTEAQQEQDDLTSGFDVDDNAAREPEPPAKEPEPEPEPEYIQLTKEDYDLFKAMAGKLPTLEGSLSKIAGNAGNLQQAVDRLRAGTVAGQPVTITKEDFAELEAEFPELSLHTRTALERVVKKMGALGTGEDPQKIAEREQREATERANARVKYEMDLLDDLHPGWKDVVGYDLTEEQKGANAFRKWLALQPKAYQDTVNHTQFAATTSRAIDKFLADQDAAARKATATAPKQPTRPAATESRIQSAVQPKGAGGKAPGPAVRTERDEMLAAFNES